MFVLVIMVAVIVVIIRRMRRELLELGPAEPNGEIASSAVLQVEKLVVPAFALNCERSGLPIYALCMVAAGSPPKGVPLTRQNKQMLRRRESARFLIRSAHQLSEICAHIVGRERDLFIQCADSGL